MKNLFLLIILCPLTLWAQRESLKPIDYQELGTIIQNGGASVQRIYSYNGVDILKLRKNYPTTCWRSTIQQRRKLITNTNKSGMAKQSLLLLACFSRPLA